MMSEGHNDSKKNVNWQRRRNTRIRSLLAFFIAENRFFFHSLHLFIATIEMRMAIFLRNNKTTKFGKNDEQQNCEKERKIKRTEEKGDMKADFQGKLSMFSCWKLDKIYYVFRFRLVFTWFSQICTHEKGKNNFAIENNIKICLISNWKWRDRIEVTKEKSRPTKSQGKYNKKRKDQERK